MVTAVVLAAEGTGNIINPDGSLVVILFLFLFFVFFLNRIFFKPIGRILDERERLTEGARVEARAAVGQFKRKLADYEEQIRLARGESYRFLEQHRAEALARRGQRVEEARQAAASSIEQAKGDIARQTEQARASLAAEASQIAGSIAQTVLGRAVSGGGD